MFKWLTVLVRIVLAWLLKLWEFLVIFKATRQSLSPPKKTSPFSCQFFYQKNAHTLKPTMRTPPFHLCDAKFPQPFWLQIGSLHHPPVSFHDLQKSLRKSCHDLNVDHVDPDSGGDTKRQETLEWETLRGSGSFGDSFFEHNFLGDINVTRRITMVERYIYIYIYIYI